MQKQAFFYLIVFSLLLISCQSDKETNQSIDGIWESIGYGEILKIEVDSYQLFDITKMSCLPSQQGKVSTFGDGLSVNNDTLSLLKGAGIYQYKRIDVLPNFCSVELSEEKRKDPVYNFEVMTKTIEENFAYFKRNKINWDSLYTVSKAKIHSESTDVQLYLVLEEVIKALRDNHGYISPSDEIYDQANKLKSKEEKNQNSEELKEYGDFQIAQMVADSFLKEDMTKDSWLMQWGKLKGNIGYIQVKSMWLYADLNLSDSLVIKNGFVDTYVDEFTKMNESQYIEKEREGVGLLMDRIMLDLRGTDYMILDVRFNGGGQDAVSLEILRRFNNKRIQVATKKAISENGFTKEIPIYLESITDAYTKPVYLLTSQQSASATDFLALASLELDSFKRIGSHTNGALSDALEKELPNEWYFSISNEIYEDMNGQCYESIGIPVDFKLNYPNDRQTFFRKMANQSENDKENIFKAIEQLRNE